MLKKIFFLLLLFLGASHFAFSQIQFQPPSYDFGKVDPGKHYTCKVKIINISDKTATFSEPRSEGGYLKARIGKNLLIPKTFTWMTVDYLPDEKVKVLKSMRVVFSVSHQMKKGEMSKTWDFHFTAEVSPSHSFLPEKMVTSYVSINLNKASGVDGKLIVDKDTYPGWHFIRAEADSNTFMVQVKPLPTPYAYSVHLVMPPQLAPGIYDGKVLIEGSDKSVTFEYPYQVTINSSWNVEPRNLTLGFLDSEEFKTWKGETKVRQLYGKPFKILKVENVPSWLKYNIQKADKEYLIRWELDYGKFHEENEKKIQPRVLSLLTDFKEEASILLPLMVFSGDMKAKTMPTPPWSVAPQGLPFMKNAN